MWPFKGKSEIRKLEDAFADPGTQYAKMIFQLGDWDVDNKDNVEWWAIYLNSDKGTIIVTEPLGNFYEACAIARNRGLPYAIIRTSAKEQYSVETVLNAFVYKYAGGKQLERVIDT